MPIKNQTSRIANIIRLLQIINSERALGWINKISQTEEEEKVFSKDYSKRSKVLYAKDKAAYTVFKAEAKILRHKLSETLAKAIIFTKKNSPVGYEFVDENKLEKFVSSMEFTTTLQTLTWREVVSFFKEQG